MCLDFRRGTTWCPTILPESAWYRTLLGDEPQNLILIDRRAFSEEEIHRIAEAFPESELETDLDCVLKRLDEYANFKWSNPGFSKK